MTAPFSLEQLRRENSFLCTALAVCANAKDKVRLKEEYERNCTELKSALAKDKEEKSKTIRLAYKWG